MTDQKEIEHIILNFYSFLFTSQNPTSFVIENITSLITPLVDQDMNTKLEMPFTKEDIRKALFDLNSSKAPDLDVSRPSSSKMLGIWWAKRSAGLP